MPPYHIDTDDVRTFTIDDTTQDLLDSAAVRQAVLTALLNLSRDKMLNISRDELAGGDRKTFHASARNPSGDIVYSASLTVAGDWSKCRMPPGGHRWLSPSGSGHAFSAPRSRCHLPKLMP